MKPLVSILWEQPGQKALLIAMGRSQWGLARQAARKAAEVMGDLAAEELSTPTKADRWSALLSQGSTFTLVHYIPERGEPVAGSPVENPSSAEALAKSAMADHRAYRKALKPTHVGKSARNPRPRPHPTRVRPQVVRCMRSA
ncbi:hypothetical protein HZA86_01980 [Candidatus Uhrbacteria bacterium]|nr:hypothetical protein [Candidatus Uhrbacteria bacterium]